MFVILRRACALVRIPLSRFVNLTLTKQIPLQGQTRGVLGLASSHASVYVCKRKVFFSGLAYRLHHVKKHSPELRGAFENTGLSFSCGRTRVNRGDVVVVAFLCGGTENSSNTPRVDANFFKKKWRKNILFQKYRNAYRRDLNVTESLVWRKHKCNSLNNPLP